MADDSYFDETGTLLVISGGGIPLYSARGLTQTFEAIAQAQNVRRTVNGASVDVSAPQFRKYRSTITCTDQAPPAWDGLWPGMEVQVECVAQLSYKTAGGSPERAVVPGSQREQGDHTLYRPILAMRILSKQQQEVEWRAELAWTLELEEI